MKLKYSLFLVLILLLNANIIYPEIVAIERARKVAAGIYIERAANLKMLKFQTIEFSKEIAVTDNNQPVFYILNLRNEPGFVIVSADDITIPLLAYSDESNYDTENVPEAVKDLLDYYKEMITDARAMKITASKQITEEWRNYESGTILKGGKSKAGPLLTTKWDQDCYYNYSCPSTGTVEPNPPTAVCKHVYAGCDACAMAQIIKYHGYPAKGKGTKTYTSPNPSYCSGWPNYGSLTVNFANQTYDYTKMPNENINSSNYSEIAKLMYHCGVSIEMCYSAKYGSGAYILNIPNAYVNYFDYTGSPNNPKLYSKDNTSDENVWINALKGEIDMLRPIHYAGNSNAGTDGHAFVIDGYSGNQFHCNFGWKGACNGNYTLTSLIVNAAVQHNYSYHQYAIMPIIPKPKQAAPVANFGSNKQCTVAGGAIDFQDLSTNTPTSWQWTFPGGDPSTSTLPYPTVYYNTPGKYSVTLKASNSGGSNTVTKDNYITVGGCTTVCDTLNYPLPGTPVILMNQGGGYVYGTNTYNAGAFAVYFPGTKGMTLSKCIYWFGKRVGSGSFSVARWKCETAGPGTQIDKKTYNIGSISALSLINFPSSYEISEDGVYIGFILPTGTYDTLAIVSNQTNEISNSNNWIMGKSNGAWHSAEEVGGSGAARYLGIFPIMCPKGVGLEEIDKESGELVLFPNPAYDIFYVYSDRFKPGEMHIKIYNQIGQVVNRVVGVAGTSEIIQIEIRDLPKGMYFVSIETPQGIFTRKLSVVR
jgi:PKD repeat protein